MIKEKLNIPKSTLNNWLSNIEYSPNKEVLEIARAKSGELKHKQRIASIKKQKIKPRKISANYLNVIYL